VPLSEDTLIRARTRDVSHTNKRSWPQHTHFVGTRTQIDNCIPRMNTDENGSLQWPETFLYRTRQQTVGQQHTAGSPCQRLRMCFEGSELSWCALEHNSTYSMQLELFWLEVQSVFIRVIRGMQLPICVRVPASAGVLRSSAASSLVDVTHITGPGPDYGILSDGTWLN
jgi:hypothetical protein